MLRAQTSDLVFAQIGLRCEDDQLVKCTDGVEVPPGLGFTERDPRNEYRADCAAVGRRCVESGDGAVCAPQGTECASHDQETCTDDLTGIRACGNGFAHVIDCQAFGRSGCVRRYGFPQCR